MSPPKVTDLPIVFASWEMLEPNPSRKDYQSKNERLGLRLKDHRENKQIKVKVIDLNYQFKTKTLVSVLIHEEDNSNFI